ncbi:hypothetical protein KSF_045250 [Reticulibacter mediterranei]|uniref:SRPBCC family protein n=1 Tax=Reticulibacter mediterranei TaxID=2778369 RepID=A0A8J3N1S1_9CHLR|nr:SRPBCC family protein [Reticulibacter mediterranei]GHO94477.1 hypothetical protein KSF_045250 [Reticulibacter mediterranei]
MRIFRVEALIKRSPETVFQLLTDLVGYAAWLPPSSLYSQITEISEQPVQVGTTYLDKGKTYDMRGEVTKYKPYTRLAFHQSSFINQPGARGELDMHIRYMLTPKEEGTRVLRTCEIRTTDLLAIFQPFVIRSIRKESERIVQRMKWYLEAR